MLTLLLSETNLLIKRRNPFVVIAAPHHSINKSIPCPTHKMSDELTGFIAYSIADELEFSCVIQSNATVDPNKSEDTPYFKQIKNINPSLLIEIHAHGGKSVKPNIIEISAGKSDNTSSLKFADILNNQLKHSEFSDTFEAVGDYKQLHFKATKSITITSPDWTSLHIEIPPELRLTNKIIPFTEILTNSIGIFFNTIS